ncbi:Uncharacterised protein [Bordetella ansorpii]|uniref:Uncharacterized protein n=1 Tax=Bordetella ansorpii TaxID=288768 RepID=A0A157SW64_9BORD|nr:hypothetical protein [Bordetella ansorpii]SAI74581.1 Uncharacterised protein [Bordetella ansorpii]
MTVQIELWQLITLLLAFFGACGAVGKVLLAQTQRHLDARFNVLEAANRDEAGQWQRIERDLMQLRADLPLEYVRREDYIRGQSIIEAKLDGLAVKLENAQLRGLAGVKNAN